MAYATQLQIQMAAGGLVELTGLADWDGDGTADPDVIAEAQARADAYIDSYLRLRYETPIANPSASIIRLAADEAVYWIRSKRPQALTPDHKDERKERADELAQYRDGKLRPDEPAPPPSSAIRSTWIADCFPMSRRNSRGLW